VVGMESIHVPAISPVEICSQVAHRPIFHQDPTLGVNLDALTHLGRVEPCH
jgi:hypothetical protein